jgi:hypothetical protein
VNTETFAKILLGYVAPVENITIALNQMPEAEDVIFATSEVFVAWKRFYLMDELLLQKGRNNNESTNNQTAVGRHGHGRQQKD